MQELNNDYLDTTLTANKTNWYNSYWTSDGPVFRQTGVFDYKKVIKRNYQTMISDAIWNLGASNYTGTNLFTIEQYDAERGTITYKNSRPTTWTGKIGLIYASDYGYASIDLGCHNNLTDSSCKTNNWLYKNNGWSLTLSPCSSSSNEIFRVNGDGVVSKSITYIYNAVFPSIYLKSDIKLLIGTGEKTNPYKLEL